MQTQYSKRLFPALKASLFHFLASLAVAAVTALLVFYVWYPWPLSEIQGGRELFWLVVSVDVICGPLLTMVLWNPAKPRRELIQDMAIVVVLQSAALIYGLYTVAIVRPVYIVYEVDRLRVVSASEIDSAHLPQALPEYRSLPWGGPRLISVRPPRDSDELAKSIDESIAGRDPSLRPGWWQAYELQLPQLLTRAQPIETLTKARPAQAHAINDAISAAEMNASDLLWLPLTSARSFEWVVLIDKKQGLPRAYVAVDGFF